MGWATLHDNNVYTIQYPWSTVVSFVCKYARPGMRVLDVGCGLGNNFQPVLDRGATPVGLDLSASAIAKAHAKYPAAELHQYRFDDEWKAIPDGSIDLAYDSKGLTTAPLPAINAGLASVSRCLKPGARFLWWTMSDSGDWARAGVMDESTRYVEASVVDDVPNDTYFRGYTFLSLSDARFMAARAGLEVNVVTLLREETLLRNAARRVQEHLVIELSKIP